MDGPRRRLGAGSAAALVVGEVLGVGIFLTPAGMARGLGSPLLLLLAWVVMGGMALCGALCVGELAARHPETGGGYAFLRLAYGRRVAFLFGWMSLLVLDPGLTAALAVGLGTYAGELAPLSAAGQKAVGVAAIAMLAAINALGVGPGAGLLRGLTALKVVVLLGLAGWGLGFGRGDWSNLVPFATRRPGSGPLAPAIVGAAISAFFALAGWWDAAKVAGEVRDPGRTLPRALALGVAAVTGLYVLVSLVFLYLVPLSEVSSDRGFAAQAGAALFGRLGGRALAAAVVATVLGSLAAVVLSAPRVYVAMARDGLFPAALGRLGPRSGTPAAALLVQATLASVLALTGTFEQILGYFVPITLAFLALMVASVYVLRRREPRPSPFLTPGYPWTPLGFLLPVLALFALMAAGDPRRALLGAAVVLTGLPAYHLFARRATPRPG